MKLEKVKRVVSGTLGELPLQEGGSTFKPAGMKRDTKAGEVPENTGYVERQTEAVLKLKLNATGALGVEQLSAAEEDTLTITTSTGKQYLMSNAWVVEPGDLGEGEMEITYNSAKSPRLS
jgi:hypothetical protein